MTLFSNPWFLGIASPAAVVLVIGAAALITRLTERSRDHKPAQVHDMRTLRVAQRQIARQVTRHQWDLAYVGAAAICTWTASERHYGSARRRKKLDDALEVWTARRTEYRPEKRPTIV